MPNRKTDRAWHRQKWSWDRPRKWSSILFIVVWYLLWLAIYSGLFELAARTARQGQAHPALLRERTPIKHRPVCQSRGFERRLIESGLLCPPYIYRHRTARCFEKTPHATQFCENERKRLLIIYTFHHWFIFGWSAVVFAEYVQRSLKS